MARAVEGDVRLAVIGHEPAEEWRQQRLAVHHQAGDDLLGVEGRRLLAEVDVAVHLPGQVQLLHLGKLMRIRERPERRAKAKATNREREPARTLEPIAVDESYVSSHR